MPDVGIAERETQDRIIRLFRDELTYRYLGNWTDRDNNSNIETYLLTPFLVRRGYTPAQINMAITTLQTEADNPNRGLYAFS
jgi:type I restriction enzyme R subunit